MQLLLHGGNVSEMQFGWIAFDGGDVRAFRSGFARLNQSGLASLLNVSKGTISRWEKGHVAPTGPAVPLLAVWLIGYGIVRPQKHPPDWWIHANRPRPSSSEASSDVLIVPNHEDQPQLPGASSDEAEVPWRIALSPEEVRNAYEMAEHLQRQLGPFVRRMIPETTSKDHQNPVRQIIGPDGSRGGIL
jgi:transcriptional regulator with XRE-family HTH domain